MHVVDAGNCCAPTGSSYNDGYRGRMTLRAMQYRASLGNGDLPGGLNRGATRRMAKWRHAMRTSRKMAFPRWVSRRDDIAGNKKMRGRTVKTDGDVETISGDNRWLWLASSAGFVWAGNFRRT